MKLTDQRNGGVGMCTDMVFWPYLLCYSSHSTFERTFLIKITFPNN